MLRGLEATGSYVREHRGDIEGFFDRAFGGHRPADRGRYADQVEQVRGQLVAGVASLADARVGTVRDGQRARRARRAARTTRAPDDTAARRREPRDDGWDGSTDPVLRTYEGPEPWIRAFSRGYERVAPEVPCCHHAKTPGGVAPHP